MWCCYHPTTVKRVITGSDATLAGTYNSRSSESVCVCVCACEIVKNLSKMYNVPCIVYEYDVNASMVPTYLYVLNIIITMEKIEISTKKRIADDRI